jgi:hypothetical protein
MSDDLVRREDVLALVLQWRLESGPISTAVYDAIARMPAATPAQSEIARLGGGA